MSGMSREVFETKSWPGWGRSRLFVTGASIAPLLGLAPLSSPVMAAEVEAVTATTGAPVAVSEVVVTARHRSEDVQSIPASVAAVSAADMQRTPMTSLSDLQTLVPGLVFAQPQFDKAQIYLRGIGSNQYSAGAEGSVGIFVDGVYLARFSEMNVPLLDTQRVEVLKGPQGALYGRNTIGGAINVVTAEPTPEFSGEGAVTYGRFGQVQVSGAVSGPISDDLLFRLSMSKVKDDGYMRIANMDGPVTGNGDDYYSARGKLLWRPTERFEAELTVDYLDRHAQGEIDHLTNVDGRRGSPYLMLGPDLPKTLSNAYYSSDIYDARANVLGYQDQEGVGGALKLAWRTEAADLTSITSYRWNRYAGNNDYDATEFDVLESPKLEKAHQLGQELRASSKSGGAFTFGGKVNWLAGVNYFQEDVGRTDTLAFGAENLFAVLLNGGAPYQDNLSFTLHTKSYSVFGQAGVNLTDRLNLTLGARYTADDKVGVHRPTTTHPSPGGFVKADFVKEVDPPTYTSFDPSASLQYRFGKALMAYASYTRGSKSGAFQFTVPLPAYASVDLMAKPESVNAYELGFKSTLIERRLRFNAALFRMDYKNLQVQKRVQVDPTNPASATTLLGNAEKSRVNGFEASLAATPLANLTLDLGYQYLDAKFITFHFDPTHDYSGDVMPRSPKSSLTAKASYDVQLRSGDLAFYAAYQWSSAQFFEPDNTDPGTRQSAYGLLSASLAYTRDNWKISVWGENLTDSRYMLADVSNPPNPADGTGKPAALSVLPGRPLTFGVTAGVKF